MGTAGGDRIWGVQSMDDVVIVSTYTMGDEKGCLRAVSGQMMTQRVGALFGRRDQDCSRQDGRTILQR